MIKFSRFLCIALLVHAASANAQFSIQKAVVEVFTGSWAQYAPDGFVRLDTLLAHHPNAIAVNIHESDAMSFTEGDDIINFYGPSYPQAVINRAGAPISRGQWESTTASVLANAALVTVSFDSVLYDPGTRALDIYLRAVFTGAATGTFNFNCIIVEDSVTGTGTGFDQVNASNTTPGHAYYGAGNPIIGLPHRYVARDYLGGAWGTSGIISTTVNFGSVFTHHYSTVLPAQYNENRISLVGIVCANNGTAINQRPILNAEKCATILPPVSDFTVGTNNICKGEPVSYTSTSTGNVTSWHWTFNGGTPATSTLENPGPVVYSTPGIYMTKLVVSGITGSTTHTLNIAVDSANTGVTQTLSSLTANAAIATYQWLDCDNNYAVISGETSQQYVLTHTGSFAVEVTESGCTDTSACIVVTSFGISENETKTPSLFPNPNNGGFILHLDQSGTIEIFNALGKSVYGSSVLEGDNPMRVDIPSGAYMIMVHNKNSIHNIRLLIQ